ncbi:hypothetical protein CLAFUW4_02592 [Fulvia fulva]|uniref:SHSP domain-containing protein n=1 Tax=Passalora fulva TaxID=5499 RepID=A0A9Q8LB40_PASFU|nr:uncharacterized protein CLAFUR5_02581 [Fulvia fulva]KAK4631960.1 hypothetical protein CLAFUR4_02587 [Fulvia fulva]KAK4632495.1 hypothetical protein CLAFUR0_02589 [Fulvia fulva]UJO14240.1 hypothetical protein CLAFUR5_02581 [Fulvia fulva]WPV10584.1 hypothetical protein CLAFUW4_02592 [Fulvia fulva]WPV25958.1 hypothetical protein CLAFUW7_02592 [Fulvia fulva]
MPGSVRYFNLTAPFWDFIADMEGRSNNNSTNHEASDNEEEEQQQQQTHPSGNPWSQAWAGFPWGPVPHRGRRHGPPHHHPGPPPPPPPAEGESETEAGPSEPRDPAPPFSDNEEGNAPEGHRSHHGRHGHGPHHGPSGMGSRGRGRCGGRGGWGGRGRGHFHPYAMGGAGPFSGLAELFQSQLFSDDNTKDKASNNNEDFKPDVDVFDTTAAFIVHVSLPGAKKEDVGVNWDAEKSELSVAGVVYRPGDEELLKMLALDERRVGAFERKIRLGSRANPAQVDVEGMTARLEDGVLRVEVPRMEEGFVEVKKVDIE